MSVSRGLGMLGLVGGGHGYQSRLAAKVGQAEVAFVDTRGRSSCLWHIVNKKPRSRRLAELFIWSKARLGAEVGAGPGCHVWWCKELAFRNEDLRTAGPASSKANSGVYLFMISSVILTTAAAERADGARFGAAHRRRGVPPIVGQLHVELDLAEG